MTKKILITGSDGLVGNAIRRLNPEGAIFATRKEADLTDFAATSSLFQDAQPTHVIHLAAQVGGVGSNMAHPGEFFRNNILINTNVLEAARLAGVESLISFMSTCVFPDKCEYPLNERSLHDGPPHESNFGYAYAKRMLDVQSRAYRKEYGCNFIVGMPTNIYGPDDNFSLEDGHVLPALIHRCHLAKQSGEPFSVWGSGKPLREFVYADDIGRLALWAVENYREETPIIFSSGLETSIADMVRLICELMGFEGELTFDASKPDGQFRKPSDTTKLRGYLPDFRFVPIEEGLKATVEWFLENQETLRK